MKAKISTIKKKLWRIFSEYIRLRDCIATTSSPDAGLCFTCGKRYIYRQLQAGHFVGGRHNGNLYSERGTNAQCYYCNIILKGNILEYRRQVIKRFGENADLDLEAEAKLTRQYKAQDLLDLIAHYQQKVDVLKFSPITHELRPEYAKCP